MIINTELISSHDANFLEYYINKMDLNTQNEITEESLIPQKEKKQSLNASGDNLLAIDQQASQTTSIFKNKWLKKCVITVFGLGAFITIMDLIIQCAKENSPTYVLSKIVGWAIVAGSLLMKIPQIVKILENNSAEGLAVESFYIEVSPFF